MASRTTYSVFLIRYKLLNVREIVETPGVSKQAVSGATLNPVACKIKYNGVAQKIPVLPWWVVSRDLMSSPTYSLVICRRLFVGFYDLELFGNPSRE